MIAFSWYLLKVMLCSGLLFGYYLLALRNRPHHRWNRFFLLAATGLSMALPLMHISFAWQGTDATGATQWVQLFKVVDGNGHFTEVEPSAAIGSTISWIGVTYLLLSLFLLARLASPILRLRSRIRNADLKRVEGIAIVGTSDDRAPFTFFRYIFWNERMDLNDPTSRQVLEHEMVHVREGHSLDKLFLNALLVLCWPVPFFWLIRRELGMVHEFIADESALAGKDSASFAAMVLQAAYPGHPLDLTNPFHQSPIKRRLLMLMKNQSRNVGRIGRWMALPLLLLIAAAFTLRPVPTLSDGHKSIAKKKVTVVIDAGHGGKDNGALGSDGSKEKDIALKIAQKIKSLNSNDSLNIIMTRSTDEFVDLKERTGIAKRNKADLFLSLHLNAAEDNKEKNKGMDIYLSARNKENDKASQLFGSLLHKNLTWVYDISPELKTRKELGVWVLDDPEAHNAAALLQLGYITNDQDLRFMSKAENQDNIAKAILKTLDTYTEGTEHLVAIEPVYQPSGPKPQPLYVLDGKEQPHPMIQEDINRLIKPEDIDRIDVLKGDSATAKYGPKGKDGVVEITSKKKQ
jgi:N-acetylmuramoyl-L-alanine amidase